MARSRASTLHEPAVPSTVDPLNPLKISLLPEEGAHEEDVFVSKEDDEGAAQPELEVPDRFEELPIEIRSLTERYVGHDRSTTSRLTERQVS
jgi:hypothetical protein